MKPQTLVLFGIIGSGKGTQVDYLMNFLREQGGECVHAYPGEEFRKLVESGSYIGSLIKESLHAGRLQPNFLTNAIYSNILISRLTPEKHLLSDGFPRTIAQSEAFDSMMKYFKREDVKIISINISEEEAVRRNSLRGRHDDTADGIAKRIEEYKNNVVPAMNYFKDRKGYEIYEINGSQSREEVFADIKKALKF